VAEVNHDGHQPDGAFRDFRAGCDRGADASIVWPEILATVVIGSVYFAASFSAAELRWTIISGASSMNNPANLKSGQFCLP
jgi:hypothetical protein